MHVLFQFLCTVVLVLTCSLRSPAAAAASTSSAQKPRGQSQFFQEILLGRCYARPPTGKAGDDVQCPTIVGEITSVLASSRDKDVTAASFQPYLDRADFSSPRNGAVFMSPPDESIDESSSLLATYYASSSLMTTPETTPGGALLADLVFCGVDVRSDGTVEDCRASQARLSFWKGVYAQFAANIEGPLFRILLPKDDKDKEVDHHQESWFQSLLLEAGIPNLNATSVTNVIIYSPHSSCGESKQVSQVKDALTSAGIAADSVNCTQNVQCLSDPTTATAPTTTSSTGEIDDANDNGTDSIPTTTTTTKSSSQNGQEQKNAAAAPQQRLHHSRPFTRFFFLLVVLGAGYILYVKRLERSVGVTYDRVHDVPC